MANYSKLIAESDALKLAIVNAGLSQSLIDDDGPYETFVRGTDMQKSERGLAAHAPEMIEWAVRKLKEGGSSVAWKEPPMIAIYENHRQFCLRVVMKCRLDGASAESKPAKKGRKAKSEAEA